MIRRDLPLSDDPTKWLLISQIEHARLSAELATAWRTESSAHPDEVRDELLAAILHHDDGWASSEANPTVDPESGKPYSFTELARDQSLILWRDSILRARQFGPLAGWVVAGHFVRLLVDSDDAERDSSRDWLAQVSKWRQSWLNEWHADNRQLNTVALAGECLEWVRTFDWISLWLCCNCSATVEDEPDEPMTIEPGAVCDRHVTFSPANTRAKGEPSTIYVTPWPFAGEQVEVDVLGYAVQAKRYTLADELAKNRSPVRLRWRLTPA